MDQLQYVKALSTMHTANQLTYRWPANNVITADLVDALNKGHNLEGKIIEELGWAMNQHTATDCQARHDDFVKNNDFAEYIGEVS
jgi:hypothetical protein